MWPRPFSACQFRCLETCLETCSHANSLSMSLQKVHCLLLLPELAFPSFSALLSRLLCSTCVLLRLPWKTLWTDSTEFSLSLLVLSTDFSLCLCLQDFSLCLCSRRITLFACVSKICLLHLPAFSSSCLPRLHSSACAPLSVPYYLSPSLTMGVPDITAMTSQLDALLRPDLTLSDVSRQKLFEVGQKHPIDLSNGSVQACLPLVTEVVWLSIGV